MSNLIFRLSNSQEKAVSDLFNFWRNRYLEDVNTKVNFKAPTGSGKTFMIANFIDRLISANNGNKKIFFLIATVSTAELPKQLENKFNLYKNFLQNNDIRISYVESPSKKDSKTKDKNLNLSHKNIDVMIVGKSSFGKGRIFTETGVFEAMLDEIKNDENLDLVYIRDEAHIGSDTDTSSTAELKNLNAFEDLVKNIASFSVYMTATPKSNENLVEITEEDILNDNITLLKKNSIFNLNLNDIDHIDGISLLKTACDTFKQIKKRYGDDAIEPGLLGINPAMLIQIKSKEKDKEDEFEEQISKYIEIIEQNGLTWAKYFSEEKYSSNTREKIDLNSLSQNNSSIDVIIFKVGPATGWDIPRACMLVQLREVFSEALNIQTIGRIKRNPNPDFDFSSKSIAHDYYIYSNAINSNEQKLNNWKLKETFSKRDYKIPIGQLDYQKIEKAFDKKGYQEKIKKIINFEDVKSEFKQTINYYKQNKYLIGEERTYNVGNGKTGTYIISKIFNKIDLRIFVNAQKRSLNKYFKPLDSNFIDYKYEELNKKINDLLFSKDIFKYIVYKRMITLITQEFRFFNKEANKNITANSYEISYKKMPEAFYQHIELEAVTAQVKNAIKESPNWTSLKHKEFETFAYEKISSKKDATLYLDSSAEKQFFELLKEVIENNDTLKENITLWSINPKLIGSSFDYLENDEDNTIKKSYPDTYFLINNKDALFVEIKSGNADIDKEKTQSLIKSYQKYISNFNNNEDAQIESLTMIVCKVFKENYYVLVEGYSSIKKVNEFIAKKVESNTKVNLDTFLQKFIND